MARPGPGRFFVPCPEAPKTFSFLKDLKDWERIRRYHYQHETARGHLALKVLEGEPKY